LIDNDKKKEYVSAWIKALRLGRLEDAFYWMHVVIEQLGEWYMARRMVIFAGEDCWDPHAIPLATALMTLVEKKTPDICNHFNYVNAYFCTCPKFWNTPGGIDMYRIGSSSTYVRRWALMAKSFRRSAVMGNRHAHRNWS